MRTFVLSLPMILMAIRYSEDIVGAYLIQSAKRDKMTYWKLVGSSFVPCVHRLRRTEMLCNLCLCHVVILAKVAYSFDVFHKFLLRYNVVSLYTVKKFTIDISKYLYYNLVVLNIYRGAIMKRHVHSFVWGGFAAALGVGLGVFGFANGYGAASALFFVAGIAAFTFVSCLILDNNFIGDLVGEIFSWGFISLPGLIFELSLDGIIWLLTVKLVFWILGIVLACAAGLLAIFIGSLLSLFVYPFALIKNLKGVDA